MLLVALLAVWRSTSFEMASATPGRLQSGPDEPRSALHVSQTRRKCRCSGRNERHHPSADVVLLVRISRSTSTTNTKITSSGRGVGALRPRPQHRASARRQVWRRQRQQLPRVQVQAAAEDQLLRRCCARTTAATPEVALGLPAQSPRPRPCPHRRASVHPLLPTSLGGRPCR